MTEMSWEQAYASDPVSNAAVHTNAQGEWDAFVEPVVGHPELREVTVGVQSVQMPVEQVSQHLQAQGIDPSTGWQ
jgi:hypothetical protein